MSVEVREYGSEFDWASTDACLAEAHTSLPLNSKNTYYFRSGRDALKAVAKKYADTHKKVLLPALCCDSMASPFSMNGYEVMFYRLNEDCTADEDDIISKLSDDCVFLYMSYFGIKPLTDSQLTALREGCSLAKFVEDRTHNPLHRTEDKDFTADATVISIMKWFSIPDGGLLYSDENFDDEYSSDTLFSDIRTEAMKLKSEYLKTGDSTLKDKFREMLSKALSLLDLSDESYIMTEQSRTLLERIDYDAILSKRQKNARALYNALQELCAIGKIHFITDTPEDSTIYFPIMVDNRDAVQSVLAQNSVYCPVIWPLPEKAGEICKNSKLISENMLAIPCDQRYDEDDMCIIAKRIKQILL